MTRYIEGGPPMSARSDENRWRPMTTNPDPLPCGFIFEGRYKCLQGPDHAIHRNAWRRGPEPDHDYEPFERRQAERRADLHVTDTPDVETEPCPTCGQPVPVPQRGDHDYGIPLRAARATPPIDVTDLTETEVKRLAEALRRADYMNWTAIEVAEKIAGTVRAILAARLSEEPR